jgi:flagellar basal-body rod protein FlgC
MDSAMTIAASGMAAAISSLAASAANVANAQISGYQPATVIETPRADGGVTATIIRPPNTILSYNPAGPFANAQGMVAVPNIDFAAQMVNQLTASLAFRANAKVFQIAVRNQKSLLDMLA